MSDDEKPPADMPPAWVPKWGRKRCHVCKHWWHEHESLDGDKNSPCGVKGCDCWAYSDPPGPKPKPRLPTKAPGDPIRRRGGQALCRDCGADARVAVRKGITRANCYRCGTLTNGIETPGPSLEILIERLGAHADRIPVEITKDGRTALVYLTDLTASQALKIACRLILAGELPSPRTLPPRT